MDAPLLAAVIFVDDIARVAAFYEGVAGMTLVHRERDHAVLATPHFQLTIHALPPSSVKPPAYPAREDTWIKLCLPVADLALARQHAASLGGKLLPPAREWEARGFRACDGCDPEGNVFQLRQRVG